MSWKNIIKPKGFSNTLKMVCSEWCISKKRASKEYEETKKSMLIYQSWINNCTQWQEKLFVGWGEFENIMVCLCETFSFVGQINENKSLYFLRKKGKHLLLLKFV